MGVGPELSGVGVRALAEGEVVAGELAAVAAGRVTDLVRKPTEAN